MYSFVAILFMLVCTINGRPQGTQGQYSGSPASSDSNTTPVAILNQTQEVEPDGSFRFSYGTANGINYQESAYIKHNDNANARSSLQGGNDTENGDILVIQGEVSYTAPDGQVINLRFIADENGYQPEGDHIPTPPSGSQVQNQPDGNQIGHQGGNYRDQQSGFQQQQQQQHQQQYQGFNSQSTSQQYQGSVSQSPTNQYQGSTSQSANNQYQQQGFSSQAPNNQ